jgi:hypothetical protein
MAKDIEVQRPQVSDVERSLQGISGIRPGVQSQGNTGSGQGQDQQQSSTSNSKG